MVRLGLIGGLSWRATAYYYEIINKAVTKSLGDLENPKIIIESLCAEEVLNLLEQDDGLSLGKLLYNSIARLSNCADIVAIACNTVHPFVKLPKSLNAKFLSIMTPLKSEIERRQLQKLGVICTNFSYKHGFFRQLESTRSNLIFPDEIAMQIINKIIFKICTHGPTDGDARFLEKIIEDLISNGAEAVILGCTELGLINYKKSVRIKLLDTAKLHALALSNLAVFEPQLDLISA